MAFLEGHELRPLATALGQGLEPVGYALGQGAGALEVVVVQALRQPTQGTLRAAWRARVAGRATPVLVVAIDEGGASLCGPTGENPPVFSDVATEQVERLCRVALSGPDRHAALRFLLAARAGGHHLTPSLKDGCPPQPKSVLQTRGSPSVSF